MSSNSRGIAGGFRAMLLSDGVRMLSTGLVILLLTRVFLRPGEYGLLFLAISVLGVALLVSFPFSKSGARYLAQYRETDPSQVPHILMATLRYNLASVAVAVVVLVAFGGHIADFIGEPELQPFLVVGAAYVVAKTLLSYATISFQGFNRIRLSAAVNVVSNVGMLVFVVGFLLAGFGVFGAFLGYIAGPVIAAVVGLVVLYVGFYSRTDRTAPAEPGIARRVLEYSVPLAGTRLAHTLDTRVDIIMVGYFLNPVAVGFYTLGKQIVDFLIAPAQSLGFAVSPTYGEQMAADDHGRAARLFETTMNNTVLVYLPAAVGIALVAEPTIRYVFGEAYLGTVPVLQVFGAYVLLRAVSKIMNDSLDFIGRARARAIAEVGSSAANIGLNVVLIPPLGITGAAFATVISYTALVAVELYVVGVAFPLDVARLVRTTAAIVAVTAAMAGVVLVLQSYITGLASLFAVVFAGGLVWFVLTVASGLLDLSHARAVMTGAG